MPLNRQQAMESLKRILVLFNFDDQKTGDYLDTLMESCGWMQPFRFEEVCRVVAKNMGVGRRPVPSQFISAYKTLAHEKGWDIQDQPAKCEKCGGFGMISCSTVREMTGEVFEAVYPCDQCNRRCEVKQPLGYKSQDASLRPIGKQIELLTPHGARIALANPLLEKANFKTEHMEALLKRAAEAEDDDTPFV